MTRYLWITFVGILSIVNGVDGQYGSAASFYQRAEIHCVKDDEATEIDL